MVETRYQKSTKGKFRHKEFEIKEKHAKMKVKAGKQKVAEITE